MFRKFVLLDRKFMTCKLAGCSFHQTRVKLLVVILKKVQQQFMSSDHIMKVDGLISPKSFSQVFHGSDI